MVTVDITADIDINIDSTDIFILNTKDCPKLNRNDLLWIGMHDVNRNGEHKWASGNFPLPQPPQWYRGRPANTGELRELVFFPGLQENPSLMNECT